LFITITCNVDWSEICDLFLPKGLTTSDRPDIVCRVFKMKLYQMMIDFKKNNFFGKTTAGTNFSIHVYIIQDIEIVN